MEKDSFKRTNRPAKGELWELLDSENDVRFVMIVSDPFEFEDSTFVRVRPVSFAVENAAEDDHIFDEVSGLGASFIAPYWNEQPVLMEQLDRSVAKVAMDIIPLLPVRVSLTEQQQQFRAEEIKRTSYLRQGTLNQLEPWFEIEEGSMTAAQEHYVPEAPLMVRNSSVRESRGRLDPGWHQDSEVDHRRNHQRHYKSFAWLAVAAMLLIAFFLFKPGSSQNEAVLSKYAQAVPYGFNEEPTYGHTPERGLGEDEFIQERGLTDDWANIFREGVGYYEREVYDSAIVIWDDIPREARSLEMEFYLGVAELMIGSYEKSLEHLNYINEREVSFQYEVDFYLLLNSVALERTEETEVLLNDILSDPIHTYSTEAEDIKELLE